MARLGSLFLLALFALPVQAAGSPPPACPAGRVHIDPSAAAPGDGSLASPLRAWHEVREYRAGVCYLQRAGTVARDLVHVRDAAGSPERPVVLGAYGKGKMPEVRHSLVIDGSGYVQVSGFVITASPFAAVTLRLGSHHVTFERNSVWRAPLGLLIEASAGGGHRILYNSFSDNTLFGIGVDQVTNAPGEETVIEGNWLYSNGSHGLELAGNRFFVRRNWAFSNGRKVSGSSGIHVYAGGANGSGFFGGGSHNEITGNYTFSNADLGPNELSPGQDGNGIQLDQNTHHNLVQGNVSFFNDGAGISLYDSHENIVRGNSVFYNGRDTNKVHVHRAELFLGAGSLNLTHGNLIEGNRLQAAGDVAAIEVDAPTRAQLNTFRANKVTGPVR